MPKDPRVRSTRQHITAETEGVTIEFASDKQREVFQYEPFPVCASGGFGSAKTYALCLKALYISDMFPHNRGLIARKVYEELKNTTMSTFFKLCPAEAYANGKRSDSEKYLRLNNGSEVLWMHLDDPDTANVLRGLEINWFILDQAEEIEEEIFDVLMARLGRWDKAVVPEQLIRSFKEEWPWKNPAGKPIPPTYPMIACNPDVEMHWIYRRFHPESLEWQRKYKALGYKMWQMSSTENRFLPKQNLDAMLNQDEAFVRRFVRGEWGIPEGQIHTISPLSLLDYTPELLEHLRSTCTLHRTLDHGDASPTACGWWAVDREGNVFCYREYYRPNALISDHRNEISSLSINERYSSNLADPSIFHLTMQKYGGRWSVSDEYADCVNLPRKTAIFWQAADNNELGTRNRINEYLRVDPDRIHPVTKVRGSPRLFFIKQSDSYPQGCSYILRETRAQRRVKVGTDLGRPIFCDDRDETIPDHGYDLLRYFLASRPPVAHGESARLYGRNSFEGKRRELEEFRSKGGFRILAKEARRMSKAMGYR